MQKIVVVKIDLNEIYHNYYAQTVAVVAAAGVSLLHNCYYIIFYLHPCVQFVDYFRCLLIDDVPSPNTFFHSHKRLRSDCCYKYDFYYMVPSGERGIVFHGDHDP